MQKKQHEAVKMLGIYFPPSLADEFQATAKG